MVRAPIQPPRLAVQSLGSGSSGNALLVQHGPTRILVDCGVGFRDLAAAARGGGYSLTDLDALLLTHEHGDHVRALPYLTAPDMPVIATPGTARMARVGTSRLLPATAGQSARVGALTIWPLPVKHDALEPCGYLIETPGGNVTVLTDLGSWDDAFASALRHSNLIVLEANHDREMLRRGPYPPHLKRRVASDVGHLANDACGGALAAALATSAVGEKVPVIWLAHLSATNNRPQLAVATVRDALARADLALDITALPRRTAGPRWELPHDVTIASAPSWQPPGVTGQLRLNL